MSRQSLLAFAMLSQPAFAVDLPKPISCYQDGTNAKDIDAYMSCFTADAEMIDASRTFGGIRRNSCLGGAWGHLQRRDLQASQDSETEAGICEDGSELAELGRSLHILVGR